MDFIKKAAGSMGSSDQTQQQQTTQTGQTQQTGSGSTAPAGTNTTGQQDYGDKAFDFVSKKAGHDFTPQQDEKITDAARGAYEKYSGGPVNNKYSN